MPGTIVAVKPDPAKIRAVVSGLTASRASKWSGLIMGDQVDSARRLACFDCRPDRRSTSRRSSHLFRCRSGSPRCTATHDHEGHVPSTLHRHRFGRYRGSACV